MPERSAGMCFDDPMRRGLELIHAGKDQRLASRLAMMLELRGDLELDVRQCEKDLVASRLAVPARGL